MTEYEVYPAIMEGISMVKYDGHDPKRIEISRKRRAMLVNELPEDYDKKTFGPHLEGVFDCEVEVRDDIEDFKIIAEMSGDYVVRTLHGEEARRSVELS